MNPSSSSYRSAFIALLVHLVFVGNCFGGLLGRLSPAFLRRKRLSHLTHTCTTNAGIVVATNVPLCCVTIRGGSAQGERNDLHPSSYVDNTLTLSNEVPNVEPTFVESNDHESTSEHDTSLETTQVPTLIHTHKALYHIAFPTGHVHQSYNGSLIQPYCDIYILGTAHVSRQSCTDAQTLMQQIQPDFLFLELCTQRIAILEDEGHNATIHGTNNDTQSSTQSNSITRITSDLLTKNPGMNRVAAMSSALLTKIQADYANKLGVQIGGEFRIAFQMAKQQQEHFEQQFYLPPPTTTADITTRNGCTVILGDRPMKLTLIRAWESLSILAKIRLVIGLLWSCFRQPSEKELKEWIESILNDPNSDILTKSMEELGRTFPTIQQTILNERDQYMAAKLMQLTKLMGEATAIDGKNRVVVAIVGVGHCKGMVSLLQKYADIRTNQTLVHLGTDAGLPQPEDILRTLIETKRHRVDKDSDLNALIADVIVVDSSLNQV